MRNKRRKKKEKKHKAVYTAKVAASRPKTESVTDGLNNQPTDGHMLI